MHMRAEAKSIVGRDHMAYRGCRSSCATPLTQADWVLCADYAPVKAVVDGNLCEDFAHLPMQKQAQIAQELDRTVAEVVKKLEGV